MIFLTKMYIINLILTKIYYYSDLIYKTGKQVFNQFNLNEQDNLIRHTNNDHILLSINKYKY